MFWSGRVKDETILQAARPPTLPVIESPKVSALPVQDVTGIGKGRGHSMGTGGKAGCFVTPPSRKCGQQSAGILRDEVVGQVSAGPAQVLGPPSQQHVHQSAGCTPTESWWCFED